MTPTDRPANRRSQSSQPRLLVVDDSDADQYLIRWILRDLDKGVALEQCRDGDVALERLCDPEQPSPDLVLLDINMPRRSGHEVLQALSERMPDRTFPVIVLSTSNAPTDVECSSHFGADAYVCKPGNLRSFTAVLDDILHRFLFGGSSDLPIASLA
ncbi:MAG: response regulator [Acidobacteriota bacterium]